MNKKKQTQPLHIVFNLTDLSVSLPCLRLIWHYVTGCAFEMTDHSNVMQTTCRKEAVNWTMTSSGRPPGQENSRPNVCPRQQPRDRGRGSLTEGQVVVGDRAWATAEHEQNPQTQDKEPARHQRGQSPARPSSRRESTRHTSPPGTRTNRIHSMKWN